MDHLNNTTPNRDFKNNPHHSHTSNAINNWLISLAPSFHGSARQVLNGLALFADRHGQCFPYCETLAEASGVSKRTAKRALRLLTSLGLITVKRTPRNSLYTINVGAAYNPPVKCHSDPSEMPEKVPPRNNSINNLQVGGRMGGINGETREILTRNKKPERPPSFTSPNPPTYPPINSFLGEV